MSLNKLFPALGYVFVLVFQSFTVFAYDDELVHPKINDAAINQSDFYNGDMINSLGFNTVEKKTHVKEWIKQGGISEDNPDPRVLRHFHDPTYSASQWNKAGFGLNDSALVWAQEPSQSTLFGGTHSWVTARASFYNALTTSRKGSSPLLTFED